MIVKLRIIKGPNQGKEVRLPSPKCVIGRGETAQLRAHSDAVSRNHCVIESSPHGAIVRDLKSRNGTLVNDEIINDDTPLISGDILRVGPLEFEVILEVEAKVKELIDVAPGLSRVPSGGTTADLAAISAAVKEKAPADKRGIETKQIKIDETDSGGLAGDKPVEPGKKPEETPAKAEDDAKKKKEVGKLPPTPQGPNTKNSRQAADEFLKRMFRK